ncbi:MAG: uridylate kinase [uncultured bacterium]|nr:MAG: uridylate kinase [uncultured bacterium]
MGNASLELSHAKPVYQRILLKLSGEALQGDHVFGIDPSKLLRVSTEIASVVKRGVQVAFVIGGGNLIRGADLYMTGFDRVTADQMGMMATVINGLALRDALEKKSIPVKMMSALPVPGLVDCYDRNKAKNSLQKGKVVIFVGGTGNPLVTTDSAAALRGIEIAADIVLKATKVDGVFAADPIKNPKAKRYTSLTYDEVLEQRLGVMDLNAILLCRDHGLPLRIFNMNKQDALLRIVLGEEVGTLIKNGE